MQWRGDPESAAGRRLDRLYFEALQMWTAVQVGYPDRVKVGSAEASLCPRINGIFCCFRPALWPLHCSIRTTLQRRPCKFVPMMPLSRVSQKCSFTCCPLDCDPGHAPRL